MTKWAFFLITIVFLATMESISIECFDETLNNIGWFVRSALKLHFGLCHS